MVWNKRFWNRIFIRNVIEEKVGVEMEPIPQQLIYLE